MCEAWEVGLRYTHEIMLPVLIQGGGAGEVGLWGLVQGLLMLPPVSPSSLALLE